MKYRKVFIVCSLLVMIALIGTVAFSANSGGSRATAKPAVGAGCGSGSGGCGSSCSGTEAPRAAQPAAPQIRLTAAQQKRIDAIEKKRESEKKRVFAIFSQKRARFWKMVSDQKTPDASIRSAMNELVRLQADAELAGIFADREKQKVYTKEQRAALSSSKGCGCGSGGGCGTTAAKPQGKVK